MNNTFGINNIFKTNNTLFGFFYKIYINYNREKLKKCQYDIVFKYRKDYNYNRYIKRLSNNKLNDKGKKKKIVTNNVSNIV